MRRRIAVSMVLGLVLMFPGTQAALACHFGGIGCGDPEAQPYNPQVSVTLANNRVGAHSDVTVKLTQQDHEQFTVRIVSDFPKEAGIDLDVPAFGEKIADLTIRASIQGAATNLTGRIKDNNDPSTGFPQGGVYDWLVEVDSPTPGMPPTTAHVFADKNAADGHLHFEFTASEELISGAQQVDASVQELTTKFFGSVQGGPFLTNPQTAGNFTTTTVLSARDANEDGNFARVTRNVAVKVIGPASVTVTPAAATHRTGESHTATATVKDQDGNALSGVSVTFERTGANPGSETKTSGANGQTSHTYTGANAGADTIVATATLAQQSASGQATVNWYDPDADSLTLAPASQARNTGSQASVTATVTDQEGRALAGVTVHFEVTGANSVSGDRTTDANGNAAFGYAGTNVGEDTVTGTVAGTSLSATATVTWTEQPACAQDDHDCDGLRNTRDNCWNVPNPDQADNDRDGFGNACDSDDDNDSLQDSEEAPNGCDPFVKDTDGEGLTDWQEVKGSQHTKCNDPDTDDDGASDYTEQFQTCTNPTNPDTDGDGVKDGADNCPRISNSDQRDSDGDGKGDSCDGIIDIHVP